MATATELVDALLDGRVTLKRVAHNFRERRWPDTTNPADPNSFAAVQADQRLTAEQHAALHEAWLVADRHP